jgi:1-acyl-sn-glycerol-3-phosphate acyltransferase
MRNAIGVIRVALRLGILAADTAGTVAWLRLRRRLAPLPPEGSLRLVQAWSRRLLRTLGISLEVRGRAPQGAVLLLANHRSYLDIPVLLSQVPCAFLAKAEIANWPLFGAAARHAHTVFVRRECAESRRASRRAASQRLRAGLPFAAFPEGTTSRGPGLLPFFPGLFRVAEQEDVAVVPVAIHYAEADDAWVGDDPFLPHFLRRFRRRRVEASICFGPPVRPGDVADLKEFAELWIRSRLESAPAALLRPTLPPDPRRARAAAAGAPPS